MKWDPLSFEDFFTVTRWMHTEKILELIPHEMANQSLPGLRKTFNSN